ncbi:hypothetical protein CK203_111343 [Vitis vinifera]|uniref:Uncharacterized protein n=1 Tax=Vitis vinifera TaxID=29760 RepID=A0A438CRR8_VITVI|nr:hypothetical protein CK203_111343 [Vitis vinifera]
MPKGHLQVSSKPKGSSVSVRRKARSWPPRLEEASSTPKRNLEGGGSPETNRDTFRGKSHSRKSDLSTGFETSKAFTGKTEGEEGILQCKLVNKVRTPFSAVSEWDLPFHRGGASCSEGVVVSLETSNQKSKDRPLLRETLSNPEVHGVSSEASFPVLEPSTLPLEGFQVEGLTPRKMVKVQSVLESLRIRIVRDNGKGVEGENKSALSADKVYSRRKRKNESGTRGED